MEELIKELEKVGLTTEQYEESLKDCYDKIDKLNELEWQDIIEKYGIKLNHDTIRKATTGIYGSRFVTQYFKLKEEMNKSDKSNFEEMKELVGNQFLLKRQIQQERLQVNKVKRQMVNCITVAEEVVNVLEREGFQVTIPERSKQPITVEESEKTLCLLLSDLHIGYLINNCRGNYYNWEIANQRVDKLLDECGKYIKLYDINTVKVFNLGDTIEGTYMRNNQSQSCEFYQSEQIVKATELIFRIITTLSEMDCNVEIRSIAGNHDRTQGDKTRELAGDNANAIIVPMLKSLVGISGNTRVNVVEGNYAETEIVTTINGLKCKFFHGDKHSSKDVLKDETSMDETFYDLIACGHLHNFQHIVGNKNRHFIRNGCLSGFNDYSTSMGCATDASQTIIVLGNHEIEMVKSVNLA